VRAQRSEGQEASQEQAGDFDSKVVSAVSEAFNNIAIHGYRDRPTGEVELEIEIHAERITLRMSDTGECFDLSRVPEPDLAGLPESRMGLYIVRSFMDEVSYEPGDGAGAPNVLTLTKRC
jgi:serine/threonine-protein kinase RsbW